MLEEYFCSAIRREQNSFSIGAALGYMWRQHILTDDVTIRDMRDTDTGDTGDHDIYRDIMWQYTYS